MSADLLAAFGNPSENAADSNVQQNSVPQATGASAHGVFQAAFGVESWGNEPTQNDSRATDSIHESKEDSHSDTDSWSAVNEEIQNAWFNVETSHKDQTSTPHNAFPSNASHSAVLSAGEEDDFGDFEEPTELPLPPKQDETVYHSRRDLGLSTSMSQEAKAEVTTGVEADEWGDFEDVQTPLPGAAPSTELPVSNLELLQLGTETSNTSLKSDPIQNQPDLLQVTDTLVPLDDWTQAITQTKAPDKKESWQTKQEPHSKANANPPPQVLALDDDLEEDWDDFSYPSDSKKSRPTKNMARFDSTGSDQLPKDSSNAATGAIPPTNVPPPSILLKLLSSIVQDLPKQLGSLATESSKSLKAQEETLQRCMSVLRAAARISAGRKLRWKRDTHLAQSMSIGMAGSKTGGMKLAGVDKGEAAREDREAAELAMTWQRSAGAIRTAVAKASSNISAVQKKPPVVMPAFSNQAASASTLRAAKPEDGGIKAPKCCVICGIRREERLEKVDVEVWDQFGEWWVEHWGHKDCQLLWKYYEEQLRQR